jgi:hypothetical protein
MLIFNQPTYFLIFKIIIKNDLNLDISLTQSNSPQSTNQIVTHSFNQNNKVQIDYLIKLISPN